MPPIQNNQSPSRYRSLLVDTDEEYVTGEDQPGTPPKNIVSNEANRAGAMARQDTPPVLNTILDRQALIKALGDLPIKEKHIDYLYYHLHRSHYPPLDKFVQDYKQYLLEHWSADASTVCSSGGSSIDSPPGSKEHRYHHRRLPTALVHFLDKPDHHGFVTTTSRVLSTESSPNGKMTKITIILQDRHVIETRLMRYQEEDGTTHASVSVSSQVGCDPDCSIYLTTKGFRRNLTCGEILEQVVHAQRIFSQDDSTVDPHHVHVIQKVTFMGTGEPLLNYEAVVDACRLLANKRTWNLCKGRITISTIGITPRIYDLTRDLPDVIIALGLHAPTQELRQQVLPCAEHYPLDALMEALDNHMEDPHNRTLLSPSGRKRKMVMIEYIMIKGETSSVECAHELGRLCENRHLVVNLIPLMRRKGDKRKCPSPDRIKEFQSVVASYGVLCNVRLNMSVRMSRELARDVQRERIRNFSENDQSTRSQELNEAATKERGEETRGPLDVVASSRSSSRFESQADDGTTKVSADTSARDVVGNSGVAASATDGALCNETASTAEASMAPKKHICNPDGDGLYRRRVVVPAMIISATVLCRIMLHLRPR